MWIRKEEKGFYSDSRLRGLRLVANKYVLPKIKEEMKDFLRWLRKYYFFPIRCRITLKGCRYFQRIDKNDADSYGDFYFDSEDKEYPEIWIACGILQRESEEVRVRRIIFTLAHEITHYFQWYFFEFDKRTNRSLEIEANRWARYILQEYYDYKMANTK